MLGSGTDTAAILQFLPHRSIDGAVRRFSEEQHERNESVGQLTPPVKSECSLLADQGRYGEILDFALDMGHEERATALSYANEMVRTSPRVGKAYRVGVVEGAKPPKGSYLDIFRYWIYNPVAGPDYVHEDDVVAKASRQVPEQWAEAIVHNGQTVIISPWREYEN